MNDRAVVTPFDRERFTRRRPMLLAMLLVAIVFALGLGLGLVLGLLAAR
jgi:hypothetical protein